MNATAAPILFSYSPSARFALHLVGNFVTRKHCQSNEFGRDDPAALLLERATHYEATQPSYADDLRAAACAMMPN